MQNNSKEKESLKIKTDHDTAIGTASPVDIYENTNEYLFKLKGARGVREYNLMRYDDTIASIIRVISAPIKGSNWIIRTQSTDEKDVEIAKFFYDYFWEQAPKVFSSILNNILLMLCFGFTVFEKVWKETYIKGKQYLMMDLQYRHQLTIERIELDKKQIVQYCDGEYLNIPFDDLLFFVNEQEGDDYWGRPIIRPCYAKWLRKKQNSGQWTIAGLKNATGFIHVTTPKTIKKTDKEYEDLKKSLSKVQEGKASILITSEGYESKIFNPNVNASFYDTTEKSIDVGMRNAALANFLGLGTTGTGTYNVGEIQYKMFLKSLKEIISYIEQTFTKQVLKPMTIVNFGDCETYPELSCQDINNDTNVALIKEALNFFREGIIKVTKKDEDDIRSKLSLPERLADDEVIELKPSIQMPTSTLQNKLKINIANSKQTPRSYAEKRKKEIDSYVEEMRRAMQSNLGLIADKAIADIRKFLKKNGVKGISELELKNRDYLTVLNKKIAFLAIKGWSNAEKLLNEAKNEKKKKTTATLDDEEINELPVVLRSFVKIKAENIINEQITALRSIVVNNANMPTNELDIDEVIGQIGLKVDEYLASSKIYGQADMAVVDTINKSEESYYLNTEDRNSIKYFTYVAVIDRNTTNYCKQLNGRTFTPYGPEYNLISIPRHYGCRSVMIPHFEEIPDKSKHDNLDGVDLSFQQF